MEGATKPGHPSRQTPSDAVRQLRYLRLVRLVQGLGPLGPGMQPRFFPCVLLPAVNFFSHLAAHSDESSAASCMSLCFAAIAVACLTGDAKSRGHAAPAGRSNVR